MAGLPMPVESPEAAAQERKRGTTLEAVEWAAQFLKSQLRGVAGGKARAYLTEREMGIAARENSASAMRPMSVTRCAIFWPQKAVPPRS